MVFVIMAAIIIGIYLFIGLSFAIKLSYELSKKPIFEVTASRIKAINLSKTHMVKIVFLWGYYGISKYITA